MRQLVVTLITIVITDITSGQYPDCVSCSDGSIPLSPLSYSTIRSNVFGGIQSSNEGCTVSTDGQSTINCGQGTTLIDCNQGVNGGDYSSFFTWNRTASVAQQVSIVFRFYQQINISNITLFFWNLPSNSITIADVRLGWADQNLQFNEITNTTTSSPNRIEDGQNILNINISDKLKFQHLRVMISFYGSGEWIFLSEVQFCGNTAPFHITQPSFDDFVQVVSTNTTVSVMCLLNITIPITMTIEWAHNDTIITGDAHTGNTTTLLIQSFQPSNVGDYQCIFNDVLGSGWTIRRNIILNINDPNSSTTSTVHPTVSTTSTTTTTTTAAISATTAAITTAATATATATTTAATTAVTSPTNTAAVVSSSSNDSTSNIVTIVAPIIVVILLIIIAVTVVIIILFFWRKKRKAYHVSNGSAEVTKKSHTTQNINYNQEPPLLYALPENNERKKDLEQSSEFSLSQNQAMLLFNVDNGQVMEFDIYANVQEYRKMVENPIYNLENPMYSEEINPAAIVTSLSHDHNSLDDNLYPFGSVYADPLPLVKSERPPVVSNKNIKPLRPLGVGQFGEVILAKTVGLSGKYLGIGNSNDSSISMKVAIKTLKSALSEESRKSFEKEIKFMSRLKDDNVVRLLGICTTGTPFIMMEYMENGDLNHYLQKFKFTYNKDNVPAANEVTLNALIYISFQIASGMEYLSSHKFVHRDLAARNILVGVNYTVKIADFGMSQNMYSGYYCRVSGRKVLPIRWMAFECFYGKFSIQTDVWAFGITLWEIFMLCQDRPFDDLSDQQMIDDAIKGPNRRIPDQPDICPSEVYCIMKSCWQHEPSERARFGLLCDQLNEFYTKIL